MDRTYDRSRSRDFRRDDGGNRRDDGGYRRDSGGYRRDDGDHRRGGGGDFRRDEGGRGDFRRDEGGRGDFRRDDGGNGRGNYQRYDDRSRSVDSRGGYRGGRGGFGQRGHGGDNSGRQPFVDKNVPMPPTMPAPKSSISFEQGTSGHEIEVLTNNFKLDIVDELLVWQYCVDIEFVRRERPIVEAEKADNGDAPTPATPVDPANDAAKDLKLEAFIKKFAPNVLGKFLETNGLGSIPYAFDGSRTLFFQSTIEHSILEGVVPIDANGRELSFKVKIERTTHLSLGAVSRYYRGEEESVPESLKQLFDIVFRDVAAKHYSIFQGSNFDLSTAAGKPGMDEVQFVNGFKACVRQTLCGYVVNVHLKTACVLSNKFTTLERIYQSNSRNNDSRDLSSINSLIKHLEVFCSHGRPRTYKIDKIVSKTPSQIFLAESEQSMVHYFKAKYNLDINPNYPVLKAQFKKDIFLPLELCALPVHQFINHRKISPAMQREVLMRSTNPPNVYFNKLDRFAKTIAQDAEKLAQFGLKMEPKPLSFKARVLPAPRNTGDDRGSRFVKPSSITKYSLFCLEAIDSQQLDNFCRDFERSAERLGMRLSLNTCKCVNIDKIQDLYGLCKNISVRLSGQIILIAIPKHNSGVMPGQIYNIVKFYSERVFSFLTQCMKADVIRNLPRGYFDNFLLKVNGKYDGVNQALVRDSFSGFGFDPAKTMLLAYDVNHPGQREITHHSIVAVVSSLDKNFSKYHSSMAKQPASYLELANIADAVESHIMSFKKTNGIFPETLVVFRDGISEGRFEQCQTLEIQSIERGIFQLGIKVNIVFLIAQKKHGVRFGLIQPNTSGRFPSYNVPAGTVVDTAVVSTKCPNFFLTSHNSPLGTARNVHYYVIRNDQKMTMDQMQNFVYRTCYNSIRSKQISSTPLALRYVDLLAYRGKQYSEANEIVQEKVDTHAISEAIWENLFYC